MYIHCTYLLQYLPVYTHTYMQCTGYIHCMLPPLPSSPLHGHFTVCSLYCIGQLGKYSEVLASTQQVLQADPNNVKALYHLGKVSRQCWWLP